MPNDDRDDGQSSGSRSGCTVRNQCYAGEGMVGCGG